MPFKNSLGIVLLGVAVGAITNLGLIGSQAYLLSNLQAIYAMYVGTAATILFSLFLKKFRLKKLQFASFSAGAALLYCLLLASLSLGAIPVEWRASLWFLLSVFGIIFFKWLAAEMTLKYLDPARAQSYFSYLVTADELGVLLVVLFMKTAMKGLNPLQLIAVLAVLYGILSVFLAIQFMPKDNIEIRFTHKAIPPAQGRHREFRAFVFVFILFTLCLGIFKTSEDYLFKVVLKETLGSFEAIKDVMTNYIFIASLISMAGSLGVAQLNKKQRLSPIRLLLVTLTLASAVGVACLLIQSLITFVALEVVRLVTGNCLTVPAYQIIFASFAEEFRHRLRSVYNLYYYAVAGVPLAVLFSYTQTFESLHQRQFILTLILFSLGLAFFLVFRLKSRLIDALYAFLERGHKTAAILSAQSLSFLRPTDFGEKMRALLKLSPKKLLRMTVILGLGYTHQAPAVKTIIEEFSSDKEEIQMAVLDALGVSRDYTAIQFLINVAMTRAKTKSLRVRMSAVFLVVGIFGRKAIPFLLNELENTDPRIVANALEALSIYRDKSLKVYFERFKDSEVPRIKANALMGLGGLRETRSEYRRVAEEALREPAMVPSLLYVIGKLKDSYFIPHLDGILNSPLKENPSVKACLAWALTKMENPTGYELFGEQIRSGKTEGPGAKWMHFFSQLPKETRFDVIRYLVTLPDQDPLFLKELGNGLRNSPFDFHEEIEYLHLVANQARPSFTFADSDSVHA